MALKYKVGDRVRIKSLDWYNENKDKNGHVECGTATFDVNMQIYCGSITTIYAVDEIGYDLDVDWGQNVWTDEMIEGLVEEKIKPEPKFKVGDKITNGEITFTILTLSSDRYGAEDTFGECGSVCFNSQDEWKIVEEENESELIPYFEEGTNKILYYKNKNTFECYFPMRTPEYICPEGYIFKDENGNVINATKIVLEKKKKEYSKTYEECYQITGLLKTSDIYGYKNGLLFEFQKLLIARDAYWKIAGEEMGLGKPWKPDYDSGVNKYGIICMNGVVQESNPTTNWERHLNKIFDFPTAEMRDAFKENFDPDIEICKELL